MRSKNGLIKLPLSLDKQKLQRKEGPSEDRHISHTVLDYILDMPDSMLAKGKAPDVHPVNLGAVVAHQKDPLPCRNVIPPKENPRSVNLLKEIRPYGKPLPKNERANASAVMNADKSEKEEN